MKQHIGFFTFFCFLALTFFLSPQSFVQQVQAAQELDSETRQVLKVISEKYQKLQHWEAAFTEENYSVALGNGTFSQGHLVFSAPNRFKYSLTEPKASDFISNGKEAWHIRYPDGRKKPAFVRHFKSLDSVELSKYLIFLRGIGKYTPQKEKELTRDFALKGAVKGKELQLVLEPRKASNLVRITLVFDQNKEAPTKAVLEDSVGSQTTIILKNPKVLKGVPAKAFQPTIPKGSKIERH